jgi:hypothetical protein
MGPILSVADTINRHAAFSADEALGVSPAAGPRCSWPALHRSSVRGPHRVSPPRVADPAKVRSGDIFVEKFWGAHFHRSYRNLQRA